MHAFCLKRRTCCGPTATQSSRWDLLQDYSHVLQCEQLTSISNHSSAVAYMIGSTLTSWNPTGYKFRGLKAEMRHSMIVWLVRVMVSASCLRAVCVLWGLSSCSLPSVRKGLAGASQPWPAGLSCPQEAGEQGAIARLHLQVVNLASTCTDTTIIVIKGARSNLFIYWFPAGSERANWGRCTFLYVCTGKSVHMTWMLCTTNIWWDIHSMVRISEAVMNKNARGFKIFCHQHSLRTTTTLRVIMKEFKTAPEYSCCVQLSHKRFYLRGFLNRRIKCCGVELTLVFKTENKTLPVSPESSCVAFIC